MKDIITNRQVLATSPLRRDALSIAEAALRAIDTETIIRESIEYDGERLSIQGRVYDLTEYRHVYIIGFGKVACTAAYTLETILKDRVRDGAVIGVTAGVCQVVETYTGTHPLPSQQNFTATKHIEEVARCAKENDLVLVIVSGGGSALLCSSMGECDQGIALFESFLQSGGTIEELNIVRKHISHLKGGGLAKALYPATVAGLIFSDVPGGDMASVASGPTCFDPTTVHDAEGLIEKYQLGSFSLVETPKDPKYFERVQNFAIVSNVTALNAMVQAAERLSYRGELLSATQYATPAETSALLLTKAREGSMRCMGGETKVQVPADCTGKGGRNEHLALSLLPQLQENQLFISLASDGHDNGGVAGALVDRETQQKATALGLDPLQYLAAFDARAFFTAAGGSLQTGLLESNVADLMFLLAAKPDACQEPISNVTGRIITDSRNQKTLEITVVAGQQHGTFAVPAGASTGEREVAVVAPKKALRLLETVVKPALCGMLVTDQAKIDARLHELDGTANFSFLGGNLALGVSVATAKAAAAVKGLETWQYIAELFEYKEQARVPRLFVNLINGGAHATAGSPLQEHQIIPDTDDLKAAFEAAKAVQRSLRVVLEKHFALQQISIGDEGGYVVPSTELHTPFTYLMEAIAMAKPSVPVLLGADIAASSFYKKGSYELLGQSYDTAGLLTIYAKLHQQFPLLQMVEDPCAESDIAGFTTYHHAHPGVLTIGDDLTTTDAVSVQAAINAEAISALIIKPNQIGTLTDTLHTMDVAYANKVWCIVSHRSGETLDDFVADLAYGTKCFGLKAGAPDRPERACKYNRLLKIAS